MLTLFGQYWMSPQSRPSTASLQGSLPPLVGLAFLLQTGCESLSVYGWHSLWGAAWGAFGDRGRGLSPHLCFLSISLSLKRCQLEACKRIAKQLVADRTIDAIL